LAGIRTTASAGRSQRSGRGTHNGADLGIVALAALAERQRVEAADPLPGLCASAIALSVLLAWIYNSTGGSLLPVVLLHATANLPVTLLITPLGIDMIQPFLIFTALLIIASIAVIGMTGSTNLSRTQRKQTSEDVPTVPTAPPTS
jgi:hypothetical protein